MASAPPRPAESPIAAGEVSSSREQGHSEAAGPAGSAAAGGGSGSEDEGTPIIFSSSYERNRNYQTTQLATHRELSNEDGASSSPDPARSQRGSPAGGPARPASGRNASASSATSTSKKSGSTARRKARLPQSARRESDRSSNRTVQPRGGSRSSTAAAAAANSEDGDDDDDADTATSTSARGQRQRQQRRRRSSSGRMRRWWHRTVDKYGSIELDNKGSVARDHLALERTFLAWLRTSLSFASIGIAITQLFRLNTTITDREGLTPDPAQDSNMLKLRQMGKPLGAAFLGIAIVVLLVGSRRYFESQHWIVRGKFPASRGSVFLVTFVAIALIIGSLAVILIVNPTQFET